MSKVNELINKYLGEPARNCMHAMYDDYVETNVNIRARSGIKTFIIRRQVANCCKWCADKAGIYDYSKAPREVYQRHDNCKCMVTFRNEKGKYIDAWSKEEYDTQRKARLSRINEIIHQGNKLDELTAKRLKAKAEGQICVDTTEIRLKHKATTGKVHDAKFYKIGRKKYRVDGHSVVFNPSEKERRTAQLLIDAFGGDIELLPEIKIPKRKKCADYSFNGIKVDRKGPSGNGKRTIFNQINEIKGQANVMALDLSETDLSLDRVVDDLNIAFGKPYYDYLDAVIITRNNKVLKVIERV